MVDRCDRCGAEVDRPRLGTGWRTITYGKWADHRDDYKSGTVYDLCEECAAAFATFMLRTLPTE